MSLQDSIAKRDQSERQKLLDKFNELDAKDAIVYGPRASGNPETKSISMIGIVARKQPRYFYSGEVAEKHRLLIVKVVARTNENNIVATEFPYSIKDLEAMWELMFDVWVKEDKIKSYCQRFLRLIFRKLAQRKLEGFAKAYWSELEGNYD